MIGILISRMAELIKAEGNDWGLGNLLVQPDYTPYVYWQGDYYPPGSYIYSLLDGEQWKAYVVRPLPGMEDIIEYAETQEEAEQAVQDKIDGMRWC